MRIGGLGDINTVAQAIITQENMAKNYGYLNNPGALTYVGQAGATKDPNSQFAQFSSYDAGYQALLNQINLNASRGQSLIDFTSIYCPASIPGCNPTAYAQSLANATGLSPDDPLSLAIAGGYDPTTGLPLDTSNLGDAAGSDAVTVAVAVGAAILLAWWLG